LYIAIPPSIKIVTAHNVASKINNGKVITARHKLNRLNDLLKKLSMLVAKNVDNARIVPIFKTS
jgi:acetylglutamate synthase